MRTIECGGIDAEVGAQYAIGGRDLAWDLDPLPIHPHPHRTLWSPPRPPSGSLRFALGRGWRVEIRAPTGETVRQRRLGSDDHEPRPARGGERDHLIHTLGGRVFDAAARRRVRRARAAVARADEDGVVRAELRALREAPDERVFAASAADHEHVPRSRAPRVAHCQSRGHRRRRRHERARRLHRVPMCDGRRETPRSHFDSTAPGLPARDAVGSVPREHPGLLGRALVRRDRRAAAPRPLRRGRRARLGAVAGEGSALRDH